MSAGQTHPKVFISYSHDSPAHKDRVGSLCDRLRLEGVDCSIDQYEPSPEAGWAVWTARQIEEADFVLVVCTEEYYKRVQGLAPAGQGRGARWEGAVITQELYDAGAQNLKFIPVLFSPDDDRYVPTPLRGATRYFVNAGDGYDELYRRLTGQPGVTRPALGQLRPMPPRQRFTTFPGEETGEAGGGREATEARAYKLGSWVFGGLLLAFFVYAFVFAGDSLPDFKQRMIGFSCAALAGLFAYFMTGTIGVQVAAARSRAGRLALNASGGLAAFALTLWWWFSAAGSAPPPAPYRLLVTVVDEQQAPAPDAEVSTSVGGALEKTGNAVWRVTLAEGARDGQEIAVNARRQPSQQGQTTIRLGEAREVPVTVKLIKDTSARIWGFVKFPSGEPAAGVRIHVYNHDDEATTTDQFGKFELPAHEAAGQDVQLVAIKDQYRAREWFAAGEQPVEVRLVKR